jgi:hypothetical protein
MNETVHLRPTIAAVLLFQISTLKYYFHWIFRKYLFKNNSYSQKKNFKIQKPNDE